MPKTKRHISSGNWIKLDVKRQSNSKELLALIETIDGVQVKEVSGVTFVQFPERKCSVVVTKTKSNRIKQSIRNMGVITSHSSKEGIEKEKEHHYCAIMLK